MSNSIWDGLKVNKKLTFLSTFISLFSSSAVQAVCDYQMVPNDPPQRRTIVCTAELENYYLAAPNEHTLINEGTILSRTHGEPLRIGSDRVAHNFVGINRGKIIWHEANPNRSRSLPAAAANIFYYSTSQSYDTTFINEKGAEIEAYVNSNTITHNIAMMGLATLARNGTLNAENRGKIITKYMASIRDPGVVGMAVSGKSVNAKNSGEILAITNVQGTYGGAAGMSLWGEYTTGDLRIENSGSIISNNLLGGVSVALDLVAITPSIDSMNVVNKGLLRSSMSGIRLYQQRGGTVDARVPLNILNQGVIEVGENGFAPIHVWPYEEKTPLNITNSGRIASLNQKNTYSIITGAGNDVISNTGDIIGNIYTSKGNDTLDSLGGKINGKIEMGAGNDKALFANTNVSNITLLSGTAFNERSVLTDESNSLLINQPFNGSSSTRGAVNDIRIINWDNISIGTGPESAMSLGYQGTGDAGALNLAGGLFSSNGIGKMHIGTMGTLALQSRNASSNYHTTVEFNGRIDLTGGSTEPGAELVIGGRYAGHPGSELIIKSRWDNPDVQINDRLTIRGNALGKTRVIVPKGILGDVTASDVEKNGNLRSPVVVVEGEHSYMNFYGSAQTANAGEAQLKKVGNRWYWTLQAVESVKEIANNEPVNNVQGPEQLPPNPTEIKPIYNSNVPSYVQLPYINREMGLSQLGRLHQRIGDGKSESQSDTKSEEQNTYHRQDWARFSLDSLQLQGSNRLGSKIRSGFIQFGRDLRFHYQEGKESYMGIMATYGWANSYFYDKYRAEQGVVSAEKYTGSAKSELFSVGGYYTVYRPNGIYLDTVGQFSLIKNHYQNDQSARLSQMGHAISAGVELGKNIILSEKLSIEPQAQLIYQWQKLNRLHDGYRQIKADDQQSLMARAGGRLAWYKDAGKKPNLYLEANLLQRLKGERSQATIGREKVSEGYARSQAEIGVGGQYALTKKLSLYSDVQYRFSLDSNHNVVYRQNSQSKNSYNARLGVKYSW